MSNLRDEAIIVLRSAGIEGADADTGLNHVMQILAVTDDSPGWNELAQQMPETPEEMQATFGADAARCAHVLKRAYT